MAFVIADRVRESTTTTGTGTITLAGAVSGFQSFSAGIGNGNSTYYTISNNVTNQWEVGIGTYTSAGSTLSRTTVLSSSNAGSLVNFSSGTADVFVTYPSERAVYAGSALGTPSSGTLTNCTGLPNAGLVNSSVTIGGTAIALGGSSSTITNDLSISGLTVGKGNSSSGTNSAFGAGALATNTTYLYNTAIGYQAGQLANGSASSTFLGARAGQATTTGQVTFVGDAAGYANTTGSFNTAVGQDSLSGNTTGANNVALGQSSLRSNTTASNNTAVGYQSLYTNITGVNNVAVGGEALKLNTTDYCTAVGYRALLNNSTGARNSAFGHYAGNGNTTGGYNTFIGSYAAESNTTGANNTVLGYQALDSNTTASNNTAVGYQAGYSNTTGTGLNAFGSASLFSNTTGTNNAGFGPNTLFSNTTGTSNIAMGVNALYLNTTGGYNVGLGVQALNNNTTASNNTAVGYQAGYTGTTGDGNTFLGYQAGYSKTTSASNTFLGAGAGYLVSTGASNTIIGRYNGNTGGLDIRTASNYIVLSDGDGNPRVYHNGSTLYITQMLSGAGSYAIKINATTGAITYDTSSARYKDNIRDSIYGLNHVMQMRSTQFEYKDDGRSDVGFIAEELDSIIPELVVKNKDGQPDAVSYDRMVSVLVKAIQELKTIVDTQAAEIAELKAKVA
jgi:hypothetical protein